MKQFVSGESDAKGFVGNSSLYCGWSGSRGNPPPGILETLGIWHGTAWQGPARPGKAGQGMWQGTAWLGMARRGGARHRTWAGVTTSKHKHTRNKEHNTTLNTCTRKTTQSH